MEANRVISQFYAHFKTAADQRLHSWLDSDQFYHVALNLHHRNVLSFSN